MYRIPEYQSYNRKIKSWVKYHFTNDGIKFTDVKQRNPTKPFKGVKKR